MVGQFFKTGTERGNKDSNSHFDENPNICFFRCCMYFFKEISWSIFVIIKCHCNNYEIIVNDVDVD